MLPCLLLAQSASVAHGHGRATPSNHESRPHVHLALATGHSGDTHGHSGAHRHSHHAGGHHAHHHDDAEEGASLTPAGDCEGAGSFVGSFALAPSQPGDHDSDALFVSSADVVMSRAGAEDGAADLVWLAAFALAIIDFNSVQVTSAPWHPPSPAERASDPPLYIRHSALLL